MKTADVTGRWSPGNERSSRLQVRDGDGSREGCGRGRDVIEVLANDRAAFNRFKLRVGNLVGIVCFGSKSSRNNRHKPWRQLISPRAAEPEKGSQSKTDLGDNETAEALRLLFPGGMGAREAGAERGR